MTDSDGKTLWSEKEGNCAFGVANLSYDWKTVERNRRFVEIGRVVYINCGLDAGKLAVVVDVPDLKQVIVDN